MKHLLFPFLLAFLMIGGKAQHRQSPKPLDPKATKETIALYAGLHKLLGKGVIFGHQDALAYGVNWQYEPGRSDVRDVSGEHPGMFGWELGHLEVDSAKSLDDVPFQKIKGFISKAYALGGINTISWHLNNPLNGKNAWDLTPGTVASILPGGSAHPVYLGYLDRLAAFLTDLRGANGAPVPILFRPFHEMTGSWFWWGQDLCTPDEYKRLWRFTVDHLRKTKGLHHILYVYNTAEFNDKEHFLTRYPGDDYVDVVSFDTYQHGGSEDFIRQIDSRLGILEKIAAERGKLPAFAETGYETIPQADWWTTVLLPPLRKYRLSYVMVWRNAGLMKNTEKLHYYAPFPGHASATDFVRFIMDPMILSGNKTQALDLYRSRIK